MGLIPDNHLLRKIDPAINLEFIRERVRDSGVMDKMATQNQWYEPQGKPWTYYSAALSADARLVTA